MGTLSKFKRRIAELNTALKAAESSDYDPDANEIRDFEAGRAKYLKSSVGTAIKLLKKDAWDLVELGNSNKDNRYMILQILGDIQKLRKDTPPNELKSQIAEISRISDSLVPMAEAEDEGPQFIEIPELPDAIEGAVAADLNEIRKCFEAGAYRSCVVLCGRVLETALLRKYYELTGKDLLETSPGIGLGKVVGKLNEKNVELDPGLKQQIHLINQVRIFSVHSKKDEFYPSKGQAQAMILYTLDVLRKIF